MENAEVVNFLISIRDRKNVLMLEGRVEYGGDLRCVQVDAEYEPAE